MIWDAWFQNLCPPECSAFWIRFFSAFLGLTCDTRWKQAQWSWWCAILLGFSKRWKPALKNNGPQGSDWVPPNTTASSCADLSLTPVRYCGTVLWEWQHVCSGFCLEFMAVTFLSWVCFCFVDVWHVQFVGFFSCWFFSFRCFTFVAITGVIPLWSFANLCAAFIVDLEWVLSLSNCSLVSR